MSKENRYKEYRRLISLNRISDIPDDLIQEFGEPKTGKVFPVDKKVK